MIFVLFKSAQIQGYANSQDDLREGRFQKSYLERAATAREKRARGDFDSWKVCPLAYGMLTYRTTNLNFGGDRNRN